MNLNNNPASSSRLTLGPPCTSRRMRRESKTVEAMIRRFCRDHHRNPPSPDDALCDQCSSLLAYARKRLRHCPFQEKKTTCGRCPVHCYAPAHRQQIRAVMRHSGPRMLLSHPLLALWHLIDGLRRTPKQP